MHTASSVPLHPADLNLPVAHVEQSEQTVSVVPVELQPVSYLSVAQIPELQVEHSLSLLEESAEVTHSADIYWPGAHDVEQSLHCPVFGGLSQTYVYYWLLSHTSLWLQVQTLLDMV